MKYTALILGFFLLLAPSVAGAQTQSCSEKGYTVVFVNGIFDTKVQADADKLALKKNLGPEYNGQPVTVQLGYNPTHLAGAGDLIQSGAELFKKSVSDFDLNTILMQVYPEVTTRKLMLVGHSQGAFYTNDLYHYLLSNGEPADAVGVYNVGSPASYTAGHGKYINSSNDTLLALLRTFNLDVLPSNADLAVNTKNADWNGHSFIDDYLAQGGSQIQSDITGEMSQLAAINATDSGDCFTPPGKNIGYKTQAAVFAVADPTATVLKVGAQTTLNASTVVFNAATKLAVGAMQMFSDAIVVVAAPPSDVQKNADTEKVVNKLYGSSLDGLSAQDKKDLLGSSQGGAVVLALQNKSVAKVGVVLGTSTEATTTETAPKSIFPQSSNGPVWGSGGGSNAQSTVSIVEPVVADTGASDTPQPDPQPDVPVVTTPQPTSTTDMSNPAVVINEIQWAGDMFDGGREWIELKNRTANDIDLSSYRLYAVDGGSQYIVLEGTLPASGYFVVERDPKAPLTGGSAQVLDFDQLADSGEQLALARTDDTGTTTIDMTPALSACSGWCAGSGVSEAFQYETLSMERVSADNAGTLPSNWASNDTYTINGGMPPPHPWNANGQQLYATPLAANSLHMPAIGFYCNPDTYPITPGQNYHPQTGQCTVLDRNIPWPGPLSAGIFKGTIGNSTQVATLPGLFHTGKIATINADFSDAQAGDQYFVVLWQPYFDGSLGGVGVYTNPLDDVRLPSYFTTGHWLARDGFNGDFTVDMTDAPGVNYTVIPFTYQP